MLNSAILDDQLAVGESSLEDSQRVRSAPFLNMPHSIQGKIPKLLSETGAFRRDKRKALEPCDFMVPYAVIVPFWSDEAEKRRWMVVPSTEKNAKIQFHAEGPWTFPNGTLFVKNFERLAADKSPHPIETRIFVVNGDASYGASYRWRADFSDADLVTESDRMSTVAVSDSRDGAEAWHYPSPQECMTCHTVAAGYVLGVNTKQLNRNVLDASENTVNQLLMWNRANLFERPLPIESHKDWPQLAELQDESQSLEIRSRSYLDVNCASCHQPGGAPTALDLRYQTPFDRTAIVNTPVRINLGVDNARAIAPHDPWRSMILLRMKTLEPIKMPPIREMTDQGGVELLERWVLEMHGPETLAPPQISPAGDDFREAIEVSIAHSTPNAIVRYTLDGSVPTARSALYRDPLRIDRSATVRARAFGESIAESVTVQETYIIDRQ